jgi:hypothetical protein
MKSEEAYGFIYTMGCKGRMHKEKESKILQFFRNPFLHKYDLIISINLLIRLLRNDSRF